MDDKRGPFDMAQEFMPKPPTLGCAFDQARDIGDDEIVFVALDHAEIRNERRERIIGDLGARRADAGDERALADRRHADERSVGHELHLELDPRFGCRFAQLGE